MKKGISLWLLVMFLSILIAALWDAVPIIKDTIHFIFDPTLGYLIRLDFSWGFLIITFLITLATTIIQKYTTDQEALKNMKEEQKAMSEEMKKYKDDPSKMMEFQKKQLENIPKTFELTMKPLVYTIAPLIFLIKWFSDIFKNLGDPKIFGMLSWFWSYMLFAIIFSIILRKVLKVY